MSPFRRLMGRALRSGRSTQPFAWAALAVVGVISLGMPAWSDDVPPVPPGPMPMAPAAPSEGKTFETPEAAAKALCRAYERNDDAALKALMGAGSEDLVEDGQEPSVRLRRIAVAEAANEKLLLETRTDGRVQVVVGPTQFPLPLPLVAKDGRWGIDVAAGRREVLARRIGENEMEAVCVCMAYADAQVRYAAEDRNEDGVKEYAQQLVSGPGARDGLYWDSDSTQEPSPAGPGLAPLPSAPPAGSHPAGTQGAYYWRILTAQGPHAAGGPYSYVINGRMIAGFALLGVPTEYRKTGVMSFLVSNQGKVFEKDLGTGTLEAAAQMVAFNPDSSWREVEAETLRDAVVSLGGEDDASMVEDEGLAEDAAQGSESREAPAQAPTPCPNSR